MEKLKTRNKSAHIRILAADDDVMALRLMTYSLVTWGYDVVTASSGEKALEEIERGGVNIVLLDWKMPEFEGIEILQRVRANPPTDGYLYMIMITAMDSVENTVTGLDAGADDYLKKPYSEDELHARIKVGERVVTLERNLAARAAELQEALDSVKQLKGLLPICMYCKKIRNDRDYWQQMEGYIHEHTDANFTHSICPECRDTVVKPMLEELQRRKKK